ncbi:rod shape-determining protein MreC [Patescibacteria group bacterium]|nr:rod shape-determining protein MreC [Patescibacteria group bacterium]
MIKKLGISNGVKKNSFFVWIVLIILILVGLNIFQKEVKSFFYSISAPIQNVFWKGGESTSNFFWGILTSGSLKERADELEKRNQALFSQIISLKEIEEENQTLRTALNLGLDSDYSLTLTKIIGKDISQDYILINKGGENGILENMPVITEEKVLVGKISEVYDKFSKVMLISNPKSSLDAKIISSSISGVIKGLGNLTIFFDLLSREEIVNNEDIVITDSISGIFPENLLIGRIKRVIKNDVESFQQAEVESAFNLSSAENLFVITEF